MTYSCYFICTGNLWDGSYTCLHFLVPAVHTKLEVIIHLIKINTILLNEIQRALIGKNDMRNDTCRHWLTTIHVAQIQI